MNKKLQMLVEEFSRELQEHFPGVSLEVYPRHRKQAYVYVMPPEKSVWGGRHTGRRLTGSRSWTVLPRPGMAPGR